MNENNNTDSELPVARRSIVNRWKQRLVAFGSPYVKRPGYRVLFVFVLIGVVLISALPEAAFLLPSLDAIGLDIVTLIAALELRHYLVYAARKLGIPPGLAGFLRAAGARASRRLGVTRRTPALLLYQCSSPLVFRNLVMGMSTIVLVFAVVKAALAA